MKRNSFLDFSDVGGFVDRVNSGDIFVKNCIVGDISEGAVEDECRRIRNTGMKQLYQDFLNGDMIEYPGGPEKLRMDIEAGVYDVVMA